VYVTHDLNEALALGDRIAIMNHGKVAQFGTPLDVFERPRDRSAARLLGFRRIWQADGAAAELAPYDGVDGSDDGVDAPAVAEMFVRPERLRILRPSEPAARTEISLGGFRISDVAYLGDFLETTVQRAGETLQVRSVRGGSTVWWRDGDEVSLAAESHDVLTFDSAGAVCTPEPESAPEPAKAPEPETAS
jgi:ABC-type Fe3+/spermidine/putrescine transport system ATPase subunit